MNSVEWITEIIGNLAWPAVVLAALFLFRKPIAECISNVRRVKYDKVEIEIREKIDQMQSEAAVALPPASGGDPPNATAEVDLYQLAAVSPSAAVLEAWRVVEAAAKGLIEGRGRSIDFAVDRPYKLMQDVLEKENLIPPKRSKIFQDLRRLRNKVAHAAGYGISEEQAVRYVDLALRLAESLEEESVGTALGK